MADHKPKKLTWLWLTFGITFVLIALLAIAVPKSPPRPDHEAFVIQQIADQKMWNPSQIRLVNLQKTKTDESTLNEFTIAIDRTAYFNDPSLSGQRIITGRFTGEPDPPVPYLVQLKEKFFPGPAQPAVEVGYIELDFPGVVEIYESAVELRPKESPANLEAELYLAVAFMTPNQFESINYARLNLLLTELQLEQIKYEDALDSLKKARPAVLKHPELKTQFNETQKELAAQLPPPQTAPPPIP